MLGIVYSERQSISMVENDVDNYRNNKLYSFKNQ